MISTHSRPALLLLPLLALLLLLASCDRPRERQQLDGPAEIAARLSRCNGTCAHDRVAADLDVIRRLGKDGAPAASILATLVSEASALYRDRGPNEATRIRGYLLATLADIAPPPEVLPQIREILLLETSPYLLAAAARVAGAVGPKAAGLREAFSRIIDPAFADDLVCLDAYNVLPTDENGTTARNEAARALSLIGPAPAAHSCCEAPAADDCCASQPAASMLPADKRAALPFSALALSDQDGSQLTWQSIFDRPAALCFFYTQCDNPRKCSSTVSRMASLQKTLAAAHLTDRTRLVLMTLDPAFDSDLVRRRYAELRGFEPSPSSVLVSSSETGLRDVVSALGVNANFGQGKVNIHGVEIFLLDGRGRVARRDGSAWSEKDIVRDLELLVSESDSRPSK